MRCRPVCQRLTPEGGSDWIVRVHCRPATYSASKCPIGRPAPVGLGSVGRGALVRAAVLTIGATIADHSH